MVCHFLNDASVYEQFYFVLDLLLVQGIGNNGHLYLIFIFRTLHTFSSSRMAGLTEWSFAVAFGGRIVMSIPLR